MVSIRKINWGQFGCNTVSIACNKFINKDYVILEILEKNVEGHRHYPNRYTIRKKDLNETEQFQWGKGYIIYLHNLGEKHEIYEPKKISLKEKAIEIGEEHTPEEISSFANLLLSQLPSNR